MISLLLSIAYVRVFSCWAEYLLLWCHSWLNERLDNNVTETDKINLILLACKSIVDAAYTDADGSAI